MRQQLERLEHESEALRPQRRASVLVAREQVLAEQAHRAARGNVESREQSEQGRLPGARRADDRHRLAGRDDQVDIIENREASRRVLHDLAEAACLDRGLDCNVSHVHHSVRRNFLIRSGLASLAALAACLAPVAAWGSPAADKEKGGPVLLVVGDSLSAEYGLSRGTGWVQLLADRLHDSGSDYRVVNASISGETTSGGRTRLPALLKEHRPRVIVLELGANDGLRGLPLNVMRDNLAAMIRQGQAAGAQGAAGRHAGSAELRPRVCRALRRPPLPRWRASSRCRSFPSCSRASRESLELFQADRIHPTAEAQPRILDNVWPVLRPLLGARTKR